MNPSLLYLPLIAALMVAAAYVADTLIGQAVDMMIAVPGIAWGVVALLAAGGVLIWALRRAIRCVETDADVWEHGRSE